MKFNLHFIGLFFLCGGSLVTGETIKVEPAETVRVSKAKLRIAKKHNGFVDKSHGKRRVVPRGSLVPDSVVLRYRNHKFLPGKDYIIKEKKFFWSLKPTPDGNLPIKQVVDLDFEYSLLRLDSIILDKDGRKIIRKGISHATKPLPPALKSGEKRIANIFVTYHNQGYGEIFYVKEGAEDAKTLTTPGRIPKTMAKIKSGKPVKIVTWGDSVTRGGDASSPEKKYVTVFTRKLNEKFPNAKITVENISVSGSFSDMWIDPVRWEKYIKLKKYKGCDWQRIVDSKPDLVTIEFVNDAFYSRKMVYKVYGEIIKRLRKMGAEVILITPHFTSMPEMGFKSYLTAKENRKYVLALIEFTKEFNLAIADASSRWGHLYKEGIPYTTLLGNGFNHPEDRGHQIFAEELIKCFEEEK